MSILSDPLNLLFLAVAVIAGFKLWQVLGQRIGHEQVLPLPEIKTTPQPTDLVLQPLPAKPAWQGFAEQGSALGQTLAAIAAADPRFDTGTFMKNAEHAHEQILSAFAKGDVAALKTLLEPHLLQVFEQEIMRRKQQGEVAVFNFVGINKATLQAARLAASRAALDVAFVSQVVSAIKNKAGVIIQGDEKQISTISELWTFERDVQAPDATWKLAATADHG